MTTLTAQQIACVYAWLAQLFSRELDDEPRQPGGCKSWCGRI